jgi:hypothetical protein
LYHNRLLEFVFSIKEVCFGDLLKHLPFAGINRIEFEFMPHWNDIDLE